MRSKRRTERRTFLIQATAWAGGVCAGVTPKRSMAATASRITKVERGARGVTLTVALAEGPYPWGESTHRDPTTLIFVPRHYVYGYRRITPKTQ